MTEAHMVPCAWYPPESIRHQLFSSKSDAWMFAVSAWEVLTLCEQPWRGLSAAQILNAVEVEQRQLAIPYLCSPQVYALLRECWRLSAGERPSFREIRERVGAHGLVDMRAKERWGQEGSTG
jgi:hypothetical protein